MTVAFWTVGVLLALIAVVIAALPAWRREPSVQKPTVGSISGSWLTEYNTKHRHDRSSDRLIYRQRNKTSVKSVKAVGK
jgi:hypothetical protein